MSTLPPLDYAAVEPERPGRLLTGESVANIWMITLVSFGVLLLVQSLYAMATLAGNNATPPTTQLSFTPAETVGLGVAASLAVLVVMIAANIVARPGGLSNMGLSGQRLVGGAIAGAACAIVVIPLVFGAAYLTQLCWQLIEYEHPNAHPLLRVFGSEGGGIIRTLVVVTAALLAPAYEELLFRGHLQTAVLYAIDRPQGRRGRWAAILIASVVFTLFHGEIWMMPPIFVLSICLGLLYEWTNNLWVPMTVHAAFNACSLGYFLWFLPRH